MRFKIHLAYIGEKIVLKRRPTTSFDKWDEAWATSIKYCLQTLSWNVNRFKRFLPSCSNNRQCFSLQTCKF